MKKRILALLLTLAMILTMMPATVFADDSADYSKVVEAIQQATWGKSSSDYTEDSWAQLNTALNNVVKGKTKAEQAEVDAMAQAIWDAFNGLVPLADYTEVDEAIATIPSDLSSYTKSSAKAVTDARYAVIRGKGNPEQNQVTAWAQAIKAAVANLAVAADYSAVDAQLGRKPQNLNIYTAESVKALDDAEAAVVRDLDITKQDEVNQMAENIKTAIDALVVKDLAYDGEIVRFVTGDGSEFAAWKPLEGTTINLVDGKIEIHFCLADDAYKGFNWGNIVASKYYDSANTPVAEIEVKEDKTIDLTIEITDDNPVYGKALAIAPIKNSFAENSWTGTEQIYLAIPAEEYVKEADYTAVNAQLERNGKIVRTLYTDESLAALDNAVNAVIEGLKEAEQEKVNKMAEDIKTAIDSLAVKPISYEGKTVQFIKGDGTPFAMWKPLKGTTYNIEGDKVTIHFVQDKDAYKGFNWDNVIATKYYDSENAPEAAVQVNEDNSITIELGKEVCGTAIGIAIVKNSFGNNSWTSPEQYYLAIPAEEYVKDADYANVDEALKKSKEIQRELYTDQSLLKLDKAINAVDRTKKAAEQPAVQAMADAINAALSQESLVYRDAIYTKVYEALSKIPANLDLYTEDTAKAVRDAKAAVDTTKDITKQSEVDEMADDINTAVAALKFRPADYTELEAAKARIPDSATLEKYYTEDTVKAVTEAQNAAEEADIRDIRDQAKVDALADAINSAINRLEYRLADYNKVTEAVSKINDVIDDINLGFYTDQSVDALTYASNAVVEGLDITQQAKVDAMAQAIEDAVDALELKDADYSKVKKAIDSIPANLDLYTKDTVNAVSAAKKAVVEGKNIKEQKTVDEMANAIEDAVTNLKFRSADYTAVDAARNKAKKLTLSNFTDKTVKTLNDAIEVVNQPVNRNKNITEQSEVDQMALNLEAALKSLVLNPAEYSSVDTALAAANSLNLDLYTYKTAKAVRIAIGSVVRGKDITKQAEVDAMAKAINDAVKALVYRRADYSAVNAAIRKIPADLDLYTDSTAKAVRAAVDAVTDKNISEQAQVNRMAKAIENAVNSLTYRKADYSRVNAALARIPSNLKKYTSDSAAKVRKAKAAVVTGKKITEQSAVDSMAKAIEAAISGLAIKEDQILKVKTKRQSTTYLKLSEASETFTPITVSGNSGKLSYAKAKGSAKYATVNSKTGSIRMKKGTPAGTYIVKVAIKAAETNDHKPAKITASVKITVKKSVPQFDSVEPLNPTVSAGQEFRLNSSLKVGVTKNFTYKKVSGSENVFLSSSGRAKVKEDTAPGTYTIKITVTANESKNFKKKTITKSIQVTVV